MKCTMLQIAGMYRRLSIGLGVAAFLAAGLLLPLSLQLGSAGLYPVEEGGALLRVPMAIG